MNVYGDVNIAAEWLQNLPPVPVLGLCNLSKERILSHVTHSATLSFVIFLVLSEEPPEFSRLAFTTSKGY